VPKTFPRKGGWTADLSTALLSGRDDKGESCSGPALLFSNYTPWRHRAPVEMTKVRVEWSGASV
jgi:hypothetical protein